MIRLNFTEEEKQTLSNERYHHPHPHVQRKMEAVWLKSQGESHQRIAQLTGVTVNTVTGFLKDFQAGGIERLKEIRFRKPVSELAAHQQTLEDYFKTHPPATIKEAMDTIEKLTGLKRSEPRIKKFLSNLGFKRRKVGTVPSKADPDKQEAFKKNIWNPVSKKQKTEKGQSFLWMLPTSS